MRLCEEFQAWLYLFIALFPLPSTMSARTKRSGSLAASATSALVWKETESTTKESVAVRFLAGCALPNTPPDVPS